MPEWRNGKRCGLKNRWGKPLTGSSPVSGTIFRVNAINLLSVARTSHLEQPQLLCREPGPNGSGYAYEAHCAGSWLSPLRHPLPIDGGRAVRISGQASERGTPQHPSPARVGEGMG